MRCIYVLLLACCVGLAHAARAADVDERSAIKAVATVREGRDIELQDDAWALAFGALKRDDEHGHVNMSLYCNEDRVCPHKMLNSSEPYSCWGTFRLFGKWVDEDDHVRAMWGGKCEGNLRSFRAPGKAIISVCSGLMKQFGARAIGTDDDDDDHHHPKLAAVRGSGCNGKHVFGMVREEGDDDDDSDDDGYSPLALHEALAAAAGDVVMRDAHIEQALRAVSAHEGRGPGRIEDSCDGKGGMFKGVVEVPHCRRARAAVEAIADVDGLEGMVNMSMIQMGVSLFQGPPPAHPPPPPHGKKPLGEKHNDHHNHKEHHDHEGHEEHDSHHSHEDHHSHVFHKLFHLGDHSTHAPPPPPQCGPPRMHCYETCNGRQPWIKGLPCWGKFEVQCSKVQDAEAAGKVVDVDDGHCGPKEVYASCEGFFSGFLGMTCRGFSTKHIVGERKDLRAFCSGKEAILIVKPSFFFRTHSRGYAAFCDGSALSTVAFEGERRAAVAA